MNVVVTPSARGSFIPRELNAAYGNFREHGPQYLNAESGLRASRYRFGERALTVCEGPESGVVMQATLQEQEAAEKASEE